MRARSERTTRSLAGVRMTRPVHAARWHVPGGERRHVAHVRAPLGRATAVLGRRAGGGGAAGSDRRHAHRARRDVRHPRRRHDRLLVRVSGRMEVTAPRDLRRSQRNLRHPHGPDARLLGRRRQRPGECTGWVLRRGQPEQRPRMRDPSRSNARVLGRQLAGTTDTPAHANRLGRDVALVARCPGDLGRPVRARPRRVVRRAVSAGSMGRQIRGLVHAPLWLDDDVGLVPNNARLHVLLRGSGPRP